MSKKTTINSRVFEALTSAYSAIREKRDLTEKEENAIVDAINAMNRPMALDIGQALSYAIDGLRVSRIGWNGKNQWVMLCVPDGCYTMETGETFFRRPYLYMKTADEMLIPWVATQSDLLAEDWFVFEG
jgi:hypothetical protein